MYILEYGDYKDETHLADKENHPSGIYCVVWGQMKNRDHHNYNKWSIIHYSWITTQTFESNLKKFKNSKTNTFNEPNNKIFKPLLGVPPDKHLIKKFRSEEKMKADYFLYIIERRNPNSKLPSC